MTEKQSWRERVRASGGLYHWLNARLIRYAGPAQIGPYGPSTPPPCGRCGAAKDAHVQVDGGALRCPEPASP
ncbi:hypothetical protein [Microbacterium sp. ZXX196]|uniref:hypothetical protein n=1 Tax=Microbacterium sp. ZXX196 TaxID=2609291 RepID=UPI0012BA21A3|nr:hypothetical protein [Microbacterium sp. ZXX196]MTE23708.1 hypothetical protein [Microbacterium sp. ZXX196]